MGDSQDKGEGSQGGPSSSVNTEGCGEVKDTASGDMDCSQDEAESSQDDSASPVNAEGCKKTTDTETGDADEGQGITLNPERLPLDESALNVYSFDQVCEMLKANALTLKRLIIYHRIPVELHDLDFVHTQSGTLNEWPRTEATHAIMIKKSDLKTLKSLLSAHHEEPDIAIPVAPFHAK